MGVLSALFVTLLLQALLGSAFSSPPSAHDVNFKTENAHTEVSGNDYCHTCVKVDSICYNHSYLFELNANFGDHPVIKKMGIMRSNNVLYYTFEPKFNDPEYSKVAYVSLDSPKYAGTITGWQAFNFYAFDINQNQKKVYLGGSDGIWVINSTNPIPTSLNERGKLITNIVSKDYLYITKQETKGILKNVNGNYVHILKDEIINNFVLDKYYNYNIVYLTDTGLYALFNSQSQTPVRLYKDPFIRGLTVDMRGTVYAWHVDGIYKVVLGKVLSESKLKLVSALTPDAMVFDKDNNIIYSNRKTLYKLTKVNTRNCV